MTTTYTFHTNWRRRGSLQSDHYIYLPHKLEGGSLQSDHYICLPHKLESQALGHRFPWMLYDGHTIYLTSSIHGERGGLVTHRLRVLY